MTEVNNMPEAQRILLFWENDEDMVKMFSYYFRQHGFLVDSIESPEKCFELCMINPPQVLMVSCSFFQPHIALEFVRSFRSDVDLPYIPIIVGEADFANNKEVEGHIEFFKMGANACFAHVFDIEDVLQQVKLLIDKPTTTNLIDKNTALLYGK